MGSSDKYLHSHDQNFKSLTRDYPIQAIEFFAHQYFSKIEGNPSVTFLKQEQRKEKLSSSFTELDVPMLLEWPDSKEKAAVVLTIEPEASPYKFNIIRLARYCLGLAEEYQTDQVYPVVVFLRRGRFRKELTLGSEAAPILNFKFLYRHLAQLDYDEWKNSSNLVARLTLPLMQYPKEKKLEVLHHSMSALLAMESDDTLRGRYTEFVTHYAEVSEADIIEYKRIYPEEGETMTGYFAQVREEGIEEGILKGRLEGRLEGREEGQRDALIRLLKRRFAQEASQYEGKVFTASLPEVERWLDNILDAQRIEDVFA